MTFTKELIFVKKTTQISQKGNQYTNLKTDDNFFLTCFDEEVIPQIKTCIPQKCVIKLTNGNRDNDYKKSLILLAVNTSRIPEEEEEC